MKVQLGDIVTSRSVKRPELRIVGINNYNYQVLVECINTVRSAVRENTNWFHEWVRTNRDWDILVDFHWDDTKYYYNFEMKSLRPIGKRVFTKSMLSRELVRLYRIAV